MSELFENLKGRLIDGLAGMGVSRQTAHMVVSEALYETMREHAGEQFRIAKSGAEQIERAQRDRAIIRDFKNGERVPLLARRYKLTRVRIWQIVNGT